MTWCQAPRHGSEDSVAALELVLARGLRDPKPPDLVARRRACVSGGPQHNHQFEIPKDKLTLDRLGILHDFEHRSQGRGSATLLSSADAPPLEVSGIAVHHGRAFAVIATHARGPHSASETLRRLSRSYLAKYALEPRCILLAGLQNQYRGRATRQGFRVETKRLKASNFLERAKECALGDAGHPAASDTTWDVPTSTVVDSTRRGITLVCGLGHDPASTLDAIFAHPYNVNRLVLVLDATTRLRASRLYAERKRLPIGSLRFVQLIRNARDEASFRTALTTAVNGSCDIHVNLTPGDKQLRLLLHRWAQQHVGEGSVHCWRLAGDRSEPFPTPLSEDAQARLHGCRTHSRQTPLTTSTACRTDRSPSFGWSFQSGGAALPDPLTGFCDALLAAVCTQQRWRISDWTWCSGNERRPIPAPFSAQAFGERKGTWFELLVAVQLARCGVQQVLATVEVQDHSGNPIREVDVVSAHQGLTTVFEVKSGQIDDGTLSSLAHAAEITVGRRHKLVLVVRSPPKIRHLRRNHSLEERNPGHYYSGNEGVHVIDSRTLADLTRLADLAQRPDSPLF